MFRMFSKNIAAICLFSVGCTQNVVSVVDDAFVSIATVSATDHETQETVAKVLKAESIECYFDGSVVYGLHVRKNNVRSAIDAIRKSRELKSNSIEVDE